MANGCCTIEQPLKTERSKPPWATGGARIVDDGQAHNDNRADRPKNRWEELAQRKKAEYDELMCIVRERVEEMNANRDKLPELVIKGCRVELGRFTLYLEFDQRPT